MMTVARSILYSSAAAVATLVTVGGRSDLVVVSAADEHAVPAAVTMGSGSSLIDGDSSFSSGFLQLLSPSSELPLPLPLSPSDRRLIVNDGERGEKVVISYEKKTKENNNNNNNNNNMMLRSASTSASTSASSFSRLAATSGSTSSGTSLVRKKAGGIVNSTRSSSSSSSNPNVNNIDIDQTISLESRQRLEETGRLISSYYLDKKHQRHSGLLPLHRRTQEEDEETIARMEKFDTCLVDVDIAVKQEPVCEFSGATELTCTNDISSADVTEFTEICTGALIAFTRVSVSCDLTTARGADAKIIYEYEPELMCAPLDVCGSVLDTFCSDWTMFFPILVESILEQSPDNSNISCTTLSNSENCAINLPVTTSPLPPTTTEASTGEGAEMATVGCTKTAIEISTDSEPSEIWNFLIGDNKRIILIPTELKEANATYSFEDCIPDKCMTFVHFDDGSDGFEADSNGSVVVAYDDEAVSFVSGDEFPSGFFSQFGSDCPNYIPPIDSSTKDMSIELVTGNVTSGLSNVIFESSFVEGGSGYSVLLSNRGFDPDTEYSLTTEAAGCVTFIMFDSLGSSESIASITIVYDGDVVSAGPFPEGSNWLVLEAGSQC